MHGNALYEWSQMLAAVGDASWRGVLDEATELFRAAGCAEKDIRGALKNHTEVRGTVGEGAGVPVQGLFARGVCMIKCRQQGPPCCGCAFVCTNACAGVDPSHVLVLTRHMCWC
jgi:hypothetical protein